MDREKILRQQIAAAELRTKRAYANCDMKSYEVLLKKELALKQDLSYMQTFYSSRVMAGVR